MAPLRWGIAGCGLISNDFAAALCSLSSEHKIVAAAARDIKSASKFGETFSIPKAYGSYNELIEDPDIDIIYVGTVGLTHYDICKSALNNNKHVLCEKLFGSLFPVYKNCERNSAPVQLEKLNSFESHSLGCNGGGRKTRRRHANVVGVYPLQLPWRLWSGTPENLAAGTVNAEVQKRSDCPITQSFEVDLPNTANIYGTKGTITIPKPFHCPTELIGGGRRDTFNLPSVGHKLEYQNSEGMVFQAEEVRNCINKGSWKAR
ncbi:putative Trans-1,2-dihydrobenzene-1,2-diol dehydrogenase [Hypsibius exemplaris]|uniref:Trans-1,2-dihydrobenzene-1,2-diol dehydrogenase n=1 Tax=Hypsibius exemplaris TaxID=2072580 RepID=A0A1W0WMG6_HYPEX|nr:putative Trans-1,2-dihydrobenzene-1,2-diol dehydrogenase [Hypsibius exemplaris]